MKFGLLVAAILMLTQAPTKPVASIEGIVVRIGTDQPIADARVLLSGSTQSGTAGNLTATTDAQGRFFLSNLDPGSYRMSFAADGYARMQYGQRVPTGLEGQGNGSDLGVVITLAAGQRLQGISAALRPTGNISGHVWDPNGRPAVDVPIQLLRATYSQNGQKSFVVIGGAKSDDRGEYRLYWITPGKYYLAFGFTASGNLRSLFGNIDTQSQYALNYFPHAYDIDGALPIDVGSGSELSGIDMVLEPLKLYRIRGHAIDQQSGKPPQGARAALNYVSFSSMGGAPTNGTYDPTDGTFELRDVTPGTYMVGISLQDPSKGTARGVPVTVTNTDVDGLVVTVLPMLSLPVNISVENREFSSIPNLNRWGITLHEDVDNSLLASRMTGVTGSIPSTDGSSRFNNVLPGRFRLQVLAAPPGVYVKEAKYKEKDVLNETFQVSASDVGAFRVVLGTGVGEIDGTIRTDSNQPAAGLRTILIPDLHRDRIDLYKSVNADASGHFVVRDIPPGDYKLFAWEAIEPYSWYNPGVMKRYEEQGKPVHVTESSKTTVDIRTIP